MPSPFDHLELLPFLRGWLAAQAAQTPGYNMSRFARRAGCSLSHVHAVFRGERGLTDKMVPAFVKALRLSGTAAVYFSLLAALSRVTADSYRAVLLRQMSALAAQRDAPMPQGLAYATLVEPRNLVLYEAAGAPGFRADPAWIAGALGWEEAAAREALHALSRAGLLAVSGGRVLRSSIDFVLPINVSRPPAEASQLWFLDACRAELVRGLGDRTGRALGLLARAADREALRQVAGALYRRVHDALDRLSHQAEAGEGPYAVYSLQVMASPISRALRPHAP